MAVIHHTTMQPTKLELIAAWLPTRDWYTGRTEGPEPVKAGGFRLNDPAGEVGIEFMTVTDGTEEGALAYLVPMTYRGAPLEGAEHALICTSEHGVLGTRWIYDGAHDPVLVGQLYALLSGRAEAQDQSLDDTPDRTVSVFPAEGGDVSGAASAELVRVVEGSDHTDAVVRVSGGEAGELALRVRRVLRDADEGDAPGLGRVIAEWRLPDGRTARGPYAVVEPVL
ncbi:1,4-alpha-glucan branching protein [Streptomyces sp. NBC_00094]|uniref:maltokinase N-terminal cap-like domain-containing protein n=1 Tax=Streptomyces sp. NBC_00094 TaxID=2903620 RepID=UPI002251F615|nr:1,4-alpha-glucan branching protein [Streptomyces sp. NBC_00094]MCX5394373.1 1,4-alpha-glucan branching protein [Streptomyces sp. NBC_00094]